MFRLPYYVFTFVILKYVSGYSQLCGNKTEKTLSCTKEIIGDWDHADYDLCQMEVYPQNSPECGTMTFGPVVANSGIGGVTLKPHIITVTHNEQTRPMRINKTVLNITFSNIKWTTMKFRFQDKYRDMKNHCLNIVISKDLTIDDQSVLYYDCYWPMVEDADLQSHVLDFEAANDWSVYRGQFYFNVPSATMLSESVTEEDWKPFVYVEIFPSKMRLHVMPPPPHLRITGYRIRVVKECDKSGSCEVSSTTVDPANAQTELTYDYNFIGDNGLYSFVVVPLHAKCLNGIGCRNVESQKIRINSPESLNICIASVTALIVTSLFAYYIALRVIRRYWCKDYKLALNDIPAPPKVLVVYPASSRLHAECVAALVQYLRAEYGLDVLYDGDVAGTPHGDPFLWAEEAFRTATHVLYAAGPPEHVHLYPNIYDKPILSAHKDVDALLLSFLRASRASRRPKHVLNVRFEHSGAALPPETRADRTFVLLQDWHKLVAYLSKNLLPKRHIMRTERGRDLIEKLTRAKELLRVKSDEAIEKCEKNAFEKKILL